MPESNEPAKPLALRAYFADVRWEGFYRSVEPFKPRCMWWLHAKRLEAVELFEGPVVSTVHPTFIEFRPVS